MLSRVSKTLSFALKDQFINKVTAIGLWPLPLKQRNLLSIVLKKSIILTKKHDENMMGIVTGLSRLYYALEATLFFD